MWWFEKLLKLTLATLRYKHCNTITGKSTDLLTCCISDRGLMLCLAVFFVLCSQLTKNKAIQTSACHMLVPILKWFESGWIGHFWPAFCLCFKTSPDVKPFKWESRKFDLHENELVSKTYFHLKGCTPGLHVQCSFKKEDMTKCFGHFIPAWDSWNQINIATCM